MIIIFFGRLPYLPIKPCSLVSISARSGAKKAEWSINLGIPLGIWLAIICALLTVLTITPATPPSSTASRTALISPSSSTERRSTSTTRFSVFRMKSDF